MRNEKDIEDMYEFIGYFNDGQFMDSKYRKGILDALSFVLYQYDSQLSNIRNHFLDKKKELK